ncbi:pimeloyl-ACP methyl ester carboxylesterase [Sphingomonas sp. PP-F2F-A104-K0414]|uniref:epoxide hydrolase family protein n=1 Tax=Sphingomonas sp. PP-F2F-A104-K0414 TaxID=2135661 RepID=UPI00104B0B88|nr:alpha/beta fold hydrolase [Sphingomonas sp. PP-F2F-A104-K0414]TCQ01019.1 pimeloyl-ACP methyl ester carboxylesterase [Sphingomonas sp. PP-F2F-A104-K0414]
MADPFLIAVPDERLATIRAKVEAFDWRMMPDAGDWRSGVGLADLKRLVDHWLTRYDWRAQERRLNALPQFTAEVQGQRLHFIHARGDGSRPPLLLLHGWPGSFLEFEALIAPLVADGHDVVVPSLPGYAFSGRPTAPIGPKRTADLMHGLMTELFGTRRYLVQGGDWGAAIAGWMAHQYPEAIAGLHLNMVLLQAEDAAPKKPDELAWAAKRADLAKEETGYSQEQGTRPQTLGVAMSDSPVGVAAWILEKFGAWADVPREAEGRPDVWRVFDEDLLITNIMLYLVEGSFVTSTWMYRGRVLEGSGKFPAGTRITVPTAIAAFPDPVFPPPPRSQAQKTYDIVQWTEMRAGGHFAALEQPDLLLADMRRFFASKAVSDAPKRSIALRSAGVIAATLAAAAVYTRVTTKRIEQDVPADGNLIDVAGARLHYVDRGTGPAIVLVHGLGAQLRNFSYGVADALAENYRVILVDRPGSGYSVPTGEQPGILGQSAIIARFIDKLGLDRPPLLVGHSLSGAVALGVATHHPGSVAGLALLAPMTQPPQAMPAPVASAIEGNPGARALFANLFGTPISRAAYGLRWGKIFAPDPVPADFATRGGGGLGDRPVSVNAALVELASADIDLTAIVSRYADLTIPVALLYGRDDQAIAPTIDGDRAVEAIPGATLEMTDGGHMLPVAHPQASAAFVRKCAEHVLR